MHDVLGLSWLFYSAMAVVLAAPFVAAIAVAVGIYLWRAIKRRRAATKRKARK